MSCFVTVKYSLENRKIFRDHWDIIHPEDLETFVKSEFQRDPNVIITIKICY